MLFRRKEESWIRSHTVFSAERLDSIRAFLVENQIPYKVQSRLGVQTSGADVSSCCAEAWHILVRKEDLYRVQHYLRTEKDW